MGTRRFQGVAATQIRWGLLVVPLAVFHFLVFLLAQYAFIGNSFHPAAGAGAVGPGLTVGNYTTLLSDSYYLRVLWRSGLMALLTVIATVVLSVPIAYYLARYGSRLARLCFAVIYVSSMTSHVIRALGWISLLGYNGPVNQLLLGLGLVRDPITFTGDGSLLGPVIGLTHYLVPYTVLVLTPVIHAIEPALEEAAYGLGASRPTVLRRILLPLMMPGIVASAILGFALSISSFTTPALLGGQRLATITLMIYQKVVVLFDFAQGAALSFILLVVVLGLVYLATALTRGRVYRV